MIARPAFPAAERARLLAVKGVGPTVIARLEQMGIASFAALAQRDAAAICAAASAILGSTCWKNSPQARRAIEAAIASAQQADAATAACAAAAKSGAIPEEAPQPRNARHHDPVPEPEPQQPSPALADDEERTPCPTSPSRSPPTRH